MRNEWPHGRTRDFSLNWGKIRKHKVQCWTITHLVMHRFPRYFSHSFFFSSSFHSCVFSLVCFSLSPLGVLVEPQNSSQWWMVCSIWKNHSFIKLLLSIKKMKRSLGPRHLEPSLHPSISLFQFPAPPPSRSNLQRFAAVFIMYAVYRMFVSSVSLQGVGPLSAGLQSYLGGRGGVAGVRCDRHQ